MSNAKADFSGFVTRNDLKCSDGRTIKAGAFKHNDGAKVPLVWQHMHDSVDNVLGHVLLEDRAFGVYGYGYFNNSSAGSKAKEMVRHGDISAMSIYANQLRQDSSKNVLHGQIREVSLVLSGANPGAFIDEVNIAHADGTYGELPGEAVIYSGENLEELQHAEEEDGKMADNDESEKPASTEEETVQDILDSMTEKQRNVALSLVGAALEEGRDASKQEAPEPTASEAKHDALDENNQDTDLKHDMEGSNMTRNLFENDNETSGSKHVLSHSDVTGILTDARRLGTVKEAVEQYALKHGIENLDLLFPDAKAISSTPELLSRRQEWVKEVIDGTNHTPFSRIKSLIADITMEEARAKGFVKGNFKKEEFFKLSKRVTTPQTIYKKQKLDRDDIVDITSFDVVAWLRGEMRIMLEEELARAILIGDGRSIGDSDKISEDHIRSIANDHELYATTVYVNIDDASSSADEIVDAITLQRHHYRGSGSPTFFTSENILARLLTAKDTLGRRLYSSVDEVASVLRVRKITPVEVFETVPDLIGIMVDLRDYNVGADKGGEVNLFDDFDIDYNQNKYLIETRGSGALVRAKSALIVRRTSASAVLVTPGAPTVSGNVVTVPTVTGVTYSAAEADGTSVPIVSNKFTLTEDNSPVTVTAAPSSTSYYFANNAGDEWLFSVEV